MQATLKRPELASEAAFVGQFLARLRDPACVPFLVTPVPKYQLTDRQMLQDIEDLATAEHWPLVRELVERVRPEQQVRAAEVVRAVKARLGV